jgi:hypothetical protein
MKKKSAFIGMMIVALGSVGFGVSKNQPVTPDDLTQLKVLNARFIHNFVTNDVASHDDYS